MVWHNKTVHAQLTTPEYIRFHRTLSEYYYQSGRHDMAWRQPEQNGNFDPYKILVSELMLQQTQAARVAEKYPEFLAQFPSVQDLAAAPLAKVLTAWNGLGYNRRAKYLWEAARSIQDEYKGEFPKSHEQLVRLPGIGSNTAGAIMAYAYDEPVIYVETNIRTVIIHHFFKDAKSVSDKEVAMVVAELLPGLHEGAAATLSNREFYWAMMDFGTYLKKTVGNKSTASKAYKKQSAFHGSVRQVRGKIIKELTAGPRNVSEVQTMISDERFETTLEALITEGLVKRRGKTLHLG